MTDRHPDCRCRRTVHVHGSRTTYVVHKCRCDACREDNRVQSRERRRAQLYGRYDKYIDAEPVRAHLRSLMAQGMGWKRIAHAASLSSSTVYAILYGKLLDQPDHPEHRPPRKRVARHVGDALLAVELDLADGAFVHAVGTARRIQALHAIGWPLQEMATRLGIKPSNFAALHTDPVQHHRRTRRLRGVQAINRSRHHWSVTKATAEAVARLYDELVDLDAAEHVTRIGHSRAIRAAQRRGWHPPAAWDAESIDDPQAAPMPTDPESVRLREQARRRIRPAYRDYQLRRAA